MREVGCILMKKELNLCCLLLGHNQSQNSEPAFCGSAWFVTHSGKGIYNTGPSHKAALLRADKEESCHIRDYSSTVLSHSSGSFFTPCFHSVFLWFIETWAAIAEISKNHEFLQFEKTNKQTNNLVSHSLYNVFFGGKNPFTSFETICDSILDWMIILADKKSVWGEPCSQQSSYTQVLYKLY